MSVRGRLRARGKELPNNHFLEPWRWPWIVLGGYRAATGLDTRKRCSRDTFLFVGFPKTPKWTVMKKKGKLYGSKGG